MTLSILGFGFMVGVGAFGFWAARRFWHDAVPATAYQRSPMWPGGEKSWRAFVRQFPVGCAAFSAMMLAYLFGVLIPSSAEWLDTLMLVFGLAWLILMGLSVTISLFNRPRLLVPPHLRHQPGWLREHRRSKRGPGGSERSTRG